MSKKERFVNILLWGVFLCYVALLLKILFLSRVSFADLLSGHREEPRSINLLPLRSIGNFLFSGSENAQRFAFSNVVGNVILFVPLGLFLPLLRKEKRVLPNLLWAFLISLGVELLQGLLVIGTADIDDLILNTLGGWAGLLLYKLFVLVFRGEKNARIAIAAVSVVVGLPVIYYLLFRIQLRL